MTLASDRTGSNPLGERIALLLALLATVPGLIVRATGIQIAHPVEALIFGIAIVGAAFVLSWAAEVAQLDISAGLAIAVLAFIAVLPEYAVDMVFAWKGGNAVEAFGPACRSLSDSGGSACSLALANMTGANRLLLGVGWSLAVFILWARTRKDAQPLTEARLERSRSVDVAVLALATAYSLIFLPLKHSITLVDAAFLIGIFGFYTRRLWKAPAEEPHLVGPAIIIGDLPDRRRRVTVVAMFLFAAAVILLLAERFAEGLVLTGSEFGVSEFLLVQWIAPLASEAPELLVAGLYAWRLNQNGALGTLLSSKVNQWTLLVGTLPIVFAIASASHHGLPIDPRQREELFLTAAQSFYGVAVLMSLSISTREALTLFSLFWAQFLIGALVPASLAGIERIGVGVAYVLLGLWILYRQRNLAAALFRDGFRTDFRALGAGSDG